MREIKIMRKKELRKIYLEKMRSQPPEEREEKSRQIAERFFKKFDLENVRFLHLYLPIEKFGEVRTEFIFRRVWRELPFIKTLAPRVDFDANEIKSVEFDEAAPLALNHWEIHEPAGDKTVESRLIDVILVPLLCFDTSGFRVGYGKGFYDRFLAKCRPDALKIGLSFFAPVRHIDDAGDFDAPLDFCVTPDEIYDLR